MLNRRKFNLSAATAAVAATALPLAWTAPARAQGAAPKAGKDYVVLKKPVAVDAPAGKVEVVEFFWYNCPHCAAFEPAFERWAKAQPADVTIKRVPVFFRDDFLPQQKLFYALEALGKVPELHVKVFTAIHTERQQLNRDGQITDWVAKQGVDKAKFLEAYNSFSVAAKVKRAAQLQDQYQIEGVPALGIAGLYTTDGSMAGSMDRALQVTDLLIAEARKKG
ncbi:thiol:disulfide interchange protein DsbA/DsbL [Xylophilus sp. ASV27]|uniref:thiol:disulfide interchange protein DsbA/DsbL n=1 Tax=Xylophilus sp. ASV27 TaxID=2795129 RepID=UPI0018EDA4A3|nr:thiol:disulfide interchange protein DsbA/DsbL [Xylophilus sp. ASV27]